MLAQLETGRILRAAEAQAMNMLGDARAMFRSLENRGIPFMLVGALAQAIHGTPRFTADVDIQIHVDEPPAPRESTWLDVIIEERTHDEGFDQDAVIVHLPTRATPIELILTSHWFTRQALGRRKDAYSDAFGRDVPVPTLEDHILLKASFHASSRRSAQKRAQDLVDIEDAIARHGDRLDSGYLRTNAERLGLRETLRGLLPGPTTPRR